MSLHIETGHPITNDASQPFREVRFVTETKALQFFEKVTAAQPLGDDECPSWGAVEFWSCYIGRRAVPAKLQSDVPPLLSSKKTREINNRWRSGTKRLIAEDVVSMDAALIGPPIPWDMVKDWRRMMLEIRDFNSSEIEKMWVSDSLYIPDVWLAGLRGASNA